MGKQAGRRVFSPAFFLVPCWREASEQRNAVAPIVAGSKLLVLALPTFQPATRNPRPAFGYRPKYFSTASVRLWTWSFS